MSPIRRRPPLHERLLASGGLLGVPGDAPGHPFRDLVGVHGVPRPRDWDAVVTAEAEGLPGDELGFVALPDGTLVVEDDLPEGALAPLADALEGALEPPYAAHAVRKSERVWAVGGRRVEVAELPDAPGDEIELTLQGGTRSVTVDGEHAFGGVRSLERLAAERFGDYVAYARRLDGDLFEVEIAAL